MLTDPVVPRVNWVCLWTKNTKIILRNVQSSYEYFFTLPRIKTDTFQYQWRCSYQLGHLRHLQMVSPMVSFKNEWNLIHTDSPLANFECASFERISKTYFLLLDSPRMPLRAFEADLVFGFSDSNELSLRSKRTFSLRSKSANCCFWLEGMFIFKLNKRNAF